MNHTKDIKIQRVENGWLVSTYSYNQDSSVMWVAETAEKLAELVIAWAENKEDKEP